ncbi:MAG: hypothetical protein HYU66_07960 [Armatimonadetes bacterium]|nr:hypothetical protein [Armatimonadota bacterium]
MRTYCWVVWYALCLAAGGALAALPGPIGHHQKVAVVVCRYHGGDDPQISAADWVTMLDKVINPYYRLLSNGRTSFDFSAVEGICEFMEDEPERLRPPGQPAPGNPLATEGEAARQWAQQAFREGQQAVWHASRKGVDFSTTTRMLAFTPRRGRACSTIGHWGIYNNGQQGFTKISLGVCPELDKDGNAAFDPATLLDNVVETDPPVKRLAQVIKNVNSRFVLCTVAHELGHQLGANDLYREGTPPGEDDYTDAWTLMGSQEFQHLDAWNRYLFGWTDPNRIKTYYPPFGGDRDAVIELASPYEATGPTGQDNSVYETIRFSFGPPSAVTGQPAVPFRGLVVENRVPSGTADTNLDRFINDFGYDDGVLVTQITQNLPWGQVVVQSRQTGDNLKHAAWQPDSGVYERRVARITLDVESKVGDRHRVKVHWGLPPSPDLFLDPGHPCESPDIWLDSPGNGFGTLSSPNRQGDGPRVPGPPELQRVSHRIMVRVRNLGAVDSVGSRGHVVVFDRPSLVDFDWTHPETLLTLGGEERGFDVPAVTANGSVTLTAADDFQPRGGPFMMIVWLEPAPAADRTPEWNPLNQVAAEAVWHYETTVGGGSAALPGGRARLGLAALTGQPLQWTAAGSPYAPVSIPLEILNADSRQRPLVFAAIPDGIPTGWQAEQRAFDAYIGPRRSAKFELKLNAPAGVKPDTSWVPTLTGYVQYGDSFVNIGQIPVRIDVCLPTTTSLEVKVAGSQATFTGRVAPSPRAASGVTVCVTGSHGKVQFANGGDTGFAVLPLDGRGNFSGSLAIEPTVSYQAVASFGGTQGRASSRSAVVSFGRASPRTPNLTPREGPGTRPGKL